VVQKGAWLLAFPHISLWRLLESIRVLVCSDRAWHWCAAFPESVIDHESLMMLAQPAELHRKLDALQRRTVTGLEGVCLSEQFWYEQAVATLWWDLDLLYQSVRRLCQRSQNKWKILEDFNVRAAMDIPVRDGELQFQWRESQNEVPSSRLGLLSTGAPFE